VKQTELITAHLRRHRSITPLQALRRYGVFRLAARIHEMKGAGFPVRNAGETRNGKKFARYVVC